MEEETAHTPEETSLEDSTTTLEVSPESSSAASPPPNLIKPIPVGLTKKPLGRRLRGFVRHFNVYLLLFGLILVIAIGLIIVAAVHNQKKNATTPLTTQNITADTLKQLKSSQTAIGDPKQILSIESNAVFAGTVLVRQNLDVAGEIKVGGALNLSGITVGGLSKLDQLQANNATITGNETVQKALTVSGTGTFGGGLSAPSLNVNTLKLNGDLQINRHIDAGGGTPSKSDGAALGGGGTSSVGGSDTAGTVTVNTGSNPAAGCFITVNFSQRFNDTPHVVITPIGSGAASLNYYVNRSSSNFSICTTNTPPSSSNFSFDYVALD